jgi:hypothetical protein
MTMRLSPPADGLHPAITVNGRSYTCAAGSTLDVPDNDALVMAANGWINHGAVAASTARPTNPQKGDAIFDSTLGITIKFDGKVWRSPVNGAAV